MKGQRPAAGVPVFGCNTLYPNGRLADPHTQFTVEAHAVALRQIRAAGFEACEYSHYHHLSEPDCAAVREAAGRAGVTPWSAHSWVALPADPDAVAGLLPEVLADIRKAALLAVRVVVFHAQRAAEATPEAVARRRRALADVLPRLDELAGELGMRLAIENCSTRADLDFLVDVVSSLAPPNIGFNIDTGHAQLHGMAPADAIRCMGSRLFTTHLHDNHGERDEHLPPGDGTIPWKSVAQALSAVHYQGVLMVELSDSPPGREPDAPAEMRRARQFLGGVLGQ